MPAAPSPLSLVLTPRRHARHAKPSAVTPVLAAGGMTLGLTVAAGAAPAAAAAPDSQWDRLAQCESGQRWGINSGNGYFGGLQFNLATWRGVGGTGYPHQHSRETQIALANRLHDARGFQPWPACSRKLGLNRSAPAKAAPVAAPARVVAAPPVDPRPRRATASANDRASRARAAGTAVRKAAPAAPAPAAVRSATGAPAFDGHVMTTADVRTFRGATRDWQARMKARGWTITVDGYFGKQSAAVASRFAAQKGLAAAPGTVNAAVFAAAWTLPVT